MSNRTLTGGIAALSWIDPKTGLPEVDKRGDPGARISRSDIKDGHLYRFSNFLEAYVTVNDAGALLDAGFTADSGMYRGPSAFGLDSAPVGKIGRTTSRRTSKAVFRQLVGSRTESPEKIGGAAGAVGGGIGGAVLVGAVAGAWAGPVGMFVGAVALGTVGYFTGREVAELVSAFPPIWTEIELTIHCDGKLEYQLVSHSVFPSNTFYALQNVRASRSDPEVYVRQGNSYDGNNVRLTAWKANGWGMAARARSGATAGSPWGMGDPGKVLGGGSLQHQCPPGYTCR